MYFSTMIATKYHYYIFFIILAISLQCCEKKKAHFTKPKIDRHITDSLLDIADTCTAKSDYDGAILHYYQGKVQAETKKDTNRIVYSLVCLAHIQYRQTDYNSAETTTIEALDMLQNKPNHLNLFDIHLLLGNIYNLQEQYIKALQHYKIAYKFKGLNKIEKLKAFNNIAWMDMNKSDFKNAAHKLEQIIKDSTLIKNNELYPIVLMNLGYCYFKNHNENAPLYLKKIQAIYPKNEQYILTSYCIIMSEYYEKTNLRLSNKYALLGYETASKIKSTDERLLLLKSLIRNSVEKQSKKYALKYILINDSITKVRMKSKIYFAKLKYDYSRFEKENVNLKLQKELLAAEERNKNNILLLTIALVLLITTIISFYLISKNKKEKRITTFETESRISKKIHDELANDLFQTINYGETTDLSQYQNKEKILNKLNTIYDQIRNFSRETKPVEIGITYTENLKAMLTEYSSNEINVILNGIEEISWNKINDEQKMDIYRILQELFINMKKHSKCSLVVLKFKKENKELKILYSDNGKGYMTSGYTTGNGIENIKNRVRHLQGSINFDKDNSGFKVNIIIPL